MKIHFALFVMHRNTSYFDNSLVKFSIPNTALTNCVRPLLYIFWNTQAEKSSFRLHYISET